MSRRMMGVIAAVVLGAVGTFVLVAYVRGAEDRAVAGERMVNVIVASSSIDSGTAAEDLGSVTKTERVPEKVRSDGAITDLSEVKGLVAATDLVPGEVLLKDRFASPGQVTKGVGEVKVPRGDMEVTLSLEPQRAVGGLIKPGDRVVVIGTPGSATSDAGLAAGVLAHQVLVTNVQIEDSSGEPSRDETQTVAPTKNLLVTVALDDATAAKVLAFAADDNVWLGAEQANLAGSTSS
jgi:pilus assembly protein CpaB